jgi:hypothetical protein
LLIQEGQRLIEDDVLPASLHRLSLLSCRLQPS